MRYNSERLDIIVLSSGNSLLFKVIKISLGLLSDSRKMHALFRDRGTSSSVPVMKIYLTINKSAKNGRCHSNIIV